MQKLIEYIKKIEDSNLIFFIEKLSDLEKINFLNLNKKIIEKIKKVINEWKNEFLSFFLWEKQFENLYIFYFNKKEKQEKIDFLWKNFLKLPEKFTILSNKDENLSNLVDASILSRYKFQDYKTEKKEDELNIIVNKNTKKIIEDRLLTLENIILARNLWETPPSDLTPKCFSEIVKKTKFKNTKVKIFEPKQIEEERLNLIHAVWKWSAHKPHMVILERIVDENKTTYGLVWKGLTFDTWWVNLKPENWLYEMKWDMNWAATVFAIMKELDRKNLNINIVACIPLAENGFWSEAYKPSDILTAYNFKTINIVNTDAEWRLVLADAMSYISKNYNLENIVTIATLTWASLIALWHRYAAIMWDNRSFIDLVLKKSKTHYEKYWELPLDNYFIEKVKWEIADLNNLDRNVYAGSSMWGAFLSHFLDNWEKYVHIDIAWASINMYEPYWFMNKWMTGFWVDSLSKVFLELK